MKLSFLSKEYIRFDERGHKNIKLKPFLKPALEMVMKKYLKKRKWICEEAINEKAYTGK